MPQFLPPISSGRSPGRAVSLQKLLVFAVLWGTRPWAVKTLAAGGDDVPWS
jgi:hypothetical protein